VLLLFSPASCSPGCSASWRAAGELAQILAPLCFLNFIASPLSYVFFVAGKQKIDLPGRSRCSCMTAGRLPAARHAAQNVLWYAIGYSLLYLVYLHMSWQCSQNRLAAA
jgi:hypothetical protein